MSRKNKNKINGNFTVLENIMTDSVPWKDLSIHARYLYFEIKKKWAGHNDRRHIIFTQKEAKNIMAIDTFIKSRNKLTENGFIDVIDRGGLFKQPAIYGLSDRWKKYGTKDFIKMKIEDIFPKIYKTKYKKGHKFMGNRFKKEEHL